MDPVTLRWVIVGELAAAVLFGALVMRPDAWILWRELAVIALAALVVVPLVAGAYLTRLDRKERAAHVQPTQRT